MFSLFMERGGATSHAALATHTYMYVCACKKCRRGFCFISLLKKEKSLAKHVTKELYAQGGLVLRAKRAEKPGGKLEFPWSMHEIDVLTS